MPKPSPFANFTWGRLKPHTRQDKRGAPLITQGLGRHRLALLLAFLLVIEHGDRLGRQLL
jgi:hypothetical protein